MKAVEYSIYCNPEDDRKLNDFISFLWGLLVLKLNFYMAILRMQTGDNIADKGK